MNSLINLMTVIGVEKTLIIACGQYAMSDYIEYTDDVSLFYLPNNILQRYDAREKARLQEAIDKCQCSQVVFLGLLDEETQRLLSVHNSLHSLRAGFCYNTKLLPVNVQPVISECLRMRALLEQHVETQCSYLMDFHFITHKVKTGKLSIRGVVGSPELNDCTTVFCNGVRFNDLVSMN